MRRYLRLAVIEVSKAGPAAMTLGVMVATAAAVASVSYTIGLKVVIDAIKPPDSQG